MNKNNEFDVNMYQYDISHGAAKSFVKFMTGIDLEGIWHTSVVVYGYEFYFQGGIVCSTPETSIHGKSYKKNFLGKTKKTKEELITFLKSIKNKYTCENYHFLKHNCNHFTDEVLKFLLNEGLSDEFLNQQNSISNTALGKFLIPKIEAWSDQIFNENKNIPLNEVLEDKNI